MRTACVVRDHRLPGLEERLQIEPRSAAECRYDREVKLSVDHLLRQNRAVPFHDMDCDVWVLGHDPADRRRERRASHRRHQSDIDISCGAGEGSHRVLPGRQSAQHLDAALVVGVCGQGRNDPPLSAGEKADAEIFFKFSDVL